MEGESSTRGCPVGFADNGRGTRAFSNKDWWPDQIDVSVLHQHSAEANPLGPAFDYSAAFSKLNLTALKRDLAALMTSSDPSWPADYGHYGPLFVRMAWHSAGTYRSFDGRGGANSGSQRFAPLNSWPDNANLDKARRLLWPIKQAYGASISWGDLLILAGNVAIETMGGPVFGFGGGREDVWDTERDVYWGPETEWLGDNRYSGERDLDAPLGAVQMGLIYVNPEGPNGNPDPLASASDIRDTFARMAMDDEETVALIAGGHTFGKAHGAGDPGRFVGPEPEGAPLHEMGLGWRNTMGSGHSGDTITSGIEGAWTPNPIRWDHDYFDVLLNNEWELTKSPAGAHQWTPTKASMAPTAPAAHDPATQEPLMMTTADMALKVDPIYVPIAKRFHADPDAFTEAFSRAWFKLTHRDMGPKSRYLGEDTPAEDLVWQDPLPTSKGTPLNDDDIATLKRTLLASGLSIPDLVGTAWASASTYRHTDHRGGANGARIRLAPQKDWPVNQPDLLKNVLAVLENVQEQFNHQQTGEKRVSLADLIVLGGSAGIEAAARNRGRDITVPFTPGRADATAEHTDAPSFDVLEPKADAFRNYFSPDAQGRPESLLIERAYLLGLTAPEMTVLFGGLRVININSDGVCHGLLSDDLEALGNDFFVNLLDPNTSWSPQDATEQVFIGRDRETGQHKWTASRVDLFFGSHAALRAISEVYAAADAEQKFLDDFVAAWTKVMNADRFDLALSRFS